VRVLWQSYNSIRVAGPVLILVVVDIVAERRAGSKARGPVSRERGVEVVGPPPSPVG
jgi:hypothetical protein